MAVIVTVSGSYSYSDRNLHVTVLGDGTVTASGMHGTTPGIGASTFEIDGDGVFKADNSQVAVGIWGSTANVAIGDGSDTVDIWGSGHITEKGVTGHDTIGINAGNVDLIEQGSATVVGSSYGVFGSATVVGGQLSEKQVGGVSEDYAVSGKITIVGGSAPTEFVSLGGKDSFHGGSGPDTFFGGHGFDTMTGGTGTNEFVFGFNEKGGTHLITNFVSGDLLNVEGHTLGYLESQGDIVTKGGNTTITIDGGKTTIELEGVTKLTSSDFTNKI